MFFNRDKNEDFYVFDSLKVYCMDQHIGKHRKYRRVFEKSEVAYLGMELSLFNKKYDERDWKVEIRTEIDLVSGEESVRMAEDIQKVKVPREEHNYKFFFGWGKDEKGDYWAEGKYEWRVFLDNELLASTNVYVVDVGPVSATHNPYFSVLSLRTYESPGGGEESSIPRQYLKTFSKETARYIMGEITFINRVSRPWPLELFFNFYDDSGLFVGTSEILELLEPVQDPESPFEVSGGIGFDDPGSWVADHYTLEVVFMNTIVAVLPFAVGTENMIRHGLHDALLNEQVAGLYQSDRSLPESPAAQIPLAEQETTGKPEPSPSEGKEPVLDPRPVAEIMEELNGLIGLENIKAKIREYIDYISFLKLRTESGIEEEEKLSLHSVFTGNPGTGKTTVVKLLGKIFQSLGLLSKGHVHTVEASDLISGYIRNTGPETKKHIEKARGGILFIDEAYNLFKEDAKNDFGADAVAALITEMSDGKGDIAIMVAGYPAEMQAFLASNPGLRSRFRNFFHFEDYQPGELLRIAEYAARRKGLKLSQEAKDRLKTILTRAFRNRDRSFGNARFAFSLIEEAKINMGTRIMRDPRKEQLTREELSLLLESDIEDPMKPSLENQLKLEPDEALLREALEELNQLIGLDKIKQEIQELIRLNRYYRENGWDVLNAFSMHTVFTGNPGTGKTTVARILAKVYKALGMLERGHLVEADGGDLIAGYVGQTALKTKEIVQKSMGGFLFVDEAYAITDGDHTDFGKKAIATLVKEMEDHRHEFGLIVAGYPENMEQFLESNPGLSSRFDRQFHFPDFTEAQLWEIALKMFADQGLKPSKGAEKQLKVFISHLYAYRDKFFGNARSIRKIVEKAARNQKLRLSDVPKEERTKQRIETLSLEDVAEFDPAKMDGIQPPKLGFKLNHAGS